MKTTNEHSWNVMDPWSKIAFGKHQFMNSNVKHGQWKQLMNTHEM